MFLVATLEKLKKETGEITFNSVLFNPFYLKYYYFEMYSI